LLEIIAAVELFSSFGVIVVVVAGCSREPVDSWLGDEKVSKPNDLVSMVTGEQIWTISTSLFLKHRLGF